MNGVSGSPPALSSTTVIDPKYYVWTFPGSPITIKIAVDVIWRLGLELDLDREVHRRGAGRSSGRNAYGLLVGTVERGPVGPVRVDIRDYAAFSSDEDSGDSSRQAASILENLRGDSSHQESEDQVIVGIFRTQPEERPSVRRCDEPLLRVKQHPEIQVVLMIACGDPDRRSAGFLFRENDSIHPFSFMDFEFDANVRNDPETELPGFEGMEDRPDGGHSDPLEPAAAPASSTVSASDTALAPGSASDSATKALRPPKVTTKVAAATRPAQEKPSPASRKQARKQSFSIVSACLAGIVAGVFGTLGTWLVLVSWSTLSPLDLQVRPVNGGMVLQWAPPSGPGSRMGGHLTVREKSGQSVLELSRDQMQTGKLFYGSAGQIVEFKLDLGDARRPRASDSVVVVSGQP